MTMAVFLPAAAFTAKTALGAACGAGRKGRAGESATGLAEEVSSTGKRVKQSPFRGYAEEDLGLAAVATAEHATEVARDFPRDPCRAKASSGHPRSVADTPPASTATRRSASAILFSYLVEGIGPHLDTVATDGRLGDGLAGGDAGGLLAETGGDSLSRHGGREHLSGHDPDRSRNAR